MVDRKAPLWNGFMALGNLAEALYFIGRTAAIPSSDNIQGAYESLITFGENVGICIGSYISKKVTSEENEPNCMGGLFNTVFGIIHYGISYWVEHSDDNSRLRYPPVSISRNIQPVVNMIGIGANAWEAYDRK